MLHGIAGRFAGPIDRWVLGGTVSTIDPLTVIVTARVVPLSTPKVGIAPDPWGTQPAIATLTTTMSRAAAHRLPSCRGQITGIM